MARTDADADAEEDGTEDGPGRRRRYHHGNLREALVEATRLLIDAHEKQGLGQSLLFGPVATGKPSAATIAAVSNELPILLRRAIGMVETESELAIMLAERLVEHKVLSGTEIAKLLDDGPPDPKELEVPELSRNAAQPAGCAEVPNWPN